jgi:hypothetical protein
MEWLTNPVGWLRRHRAKKVRDKVLGQLWMAMMLAERSLKDVFNGGRFAQPVGAALVCVPSRTVDTCRGRRLTLGDIVAASFGVLASCGMKFSGLTDMTKLGEAIADTEVKVQGDAVKLEHVAAGLAAILTREGLGMKGEATYRDGVTRSDNWVLISGVLSAVIENWANGVDQHGVLWAMSSGTNVDHHKVMVAFPHFFPGSDCWSASTSELTEGKLSG